MTTMDNPLHTAFHNKYFRKVGILLDLGVNPNKKDDNGQTILMKCCSIDNYTDRIDLVTHLLEKGADIEVVDNEGRTALFHAVLNNRFRMMKLLSDNVDFDLNTKDKSGRTVLHIASNKGYYKIVRHLVYLFRKYHIDIDVTNPDGMTALHIACAKGYYDIAKTLVYGGNASLSMRDNKQFFSPRDWLASSLHLDENIDPFPQGASLRKKWALSSVQMLQAIKERRQAKTAPGSQNDKMASNKITSDKDTISVKFSSRCKSAQISKKASSECSPTRSKTTVLENTKVSKNKKKTVQKCPNKLLDTPNPMTSRVKSAPIVMLSYNESMVKMVQKPPIISCKLTEDLVPDKYKDKARPDIGRPVSKDRTKTPGDVAFFQSSAFRSLYEMYASHSSPSYRPTARPPSPPDEVFSDDNLSSRPSTGKRLSKSRLHRAMRTHRAESIIKTISLKVLNNRGQFTSPSPSPRERKISTSMLAKQSRSDPGGANQLDIPRSPRAGRRKSEAASKLVNKASLILNLENLREVSNGSKLKSRPDSAAVKGDCPLVEEPET